MALTKSSSIVHSDRFQAMDPVRRAVTDESLIGLLKGIEMFRVLEREVPAQLISVFLYVATHQGCHKQALEEDLNIKTSSSSRLIDWLGKRHSLSSKPGLELVETYKDDGNWRRLCLRLTTRGEQLVDQLNHIVYGTS